MKNQMQFNLFFILLITTGIIDSSSYDFDLTHSAHSEADLDLVKCLPGNCFSENKTDLFVLLPEHLIGKIKHLNIGFYPHKFSEVGQIIEKI